MAGTARRRPLDPDEIQGFDHIDASILDGVRLVRTNLLPPAADGMTIGRLVLLRGERIEQRASTLLAHELVHVRQFAQMGPVRFLGQYIGEYLRNLVRLRNHRAAYLAISLEEEARREAADWQDRHPATPS